MFFLIKSRLIRHIGTSRRKKMRPVSQLLHLGRFYAKVGKNWIPTAGAWAAGGGIAFLYFTDWKVVTKRIPFIKDKYDHESPK